MAKEVQTESDLMAEAITQLQIASVVLGAAKSRAGKITNEQYKSVFLRKISLINTKVD